MVDLTTRFDSARTRCACRTMLPAAIDYKNMITLEHVARFAGLFTTDTNRLGNESLKLDANMEAIKDFLGGQVERVGDGEASSVDAEILNILSIYFTGKVNDLPAEENSDALLKRVNGWNKRPEKAATTAENSANKGQVKGTNSLADDLAKAREKHGLESAEAKACEQALMEYALSHIGK